MLPGVLAGNYSPEQMQIDLANLCRQAAAELVVGATQHVDWNRQQLMVDNHLPVDFDVISIGIGSQSRLPQEAKKASAVVAIKPMQTFLKRIRQRLEQIQVQGNVPIRLTIVGAGAAGVELAFCLPEFVRRHVRTCHGQDVDLQTQLIHAQKRLQIGDGAGLNRRIVQELDRRRLGLILGRRVESVTGNVLTLEDGTSTTSELIIWATGAAAPELLSQLGLPTDDNGFLLVDNTLRTIGDQPAFVVGDSASMTGVTVPKAGVHAVRQGPVLWENLQRTLDGRELAQYTPQTTFLKLLNCGDGTAMGEYRGLSFAGRWAWWIKNAIDTSFVRKYQ